jgi:predicted nucleic acid-binding protein
MPGKHRVNGEQAMLFIEDIRKRFTVVALDPDEVADMLRQSAAGGVLGGSVYDALLARCALKARAKTLFSWNIRHYERLGSEVVRILQRP